MKTDQMVRVSSAACIVEKITGERPHAATLHRWCSRGLKGVKLRTAYAGGHKRTTEEWIREFFDDVTAAAQGKSGTSSQSSGKSEVASAERELAEAGI